jgi:hypothetical protein
MRLVQPIDRCPSALRKEVGTLAARAGWHRVGVISILRTLVAGFHSEMSMNQLARTALAIVICLSLLPASGCVRRRLNVRSNPPGALVYVDNQQIGTTPCSVDFTYYGTREIRLIKPGYETLTVNQPIPTPWYQVPPLDFVSENLTPTKIRDNRTVTYDMAPQIVVPTEQLLDRANQLRQETLQFPVSPAAASLPVGQPTVVAPTIVTPPPVMAPAGPPTFGPGTIAPPTSAPPQTFTSPPLPAGLPPVQ